MDHAVSGRRPPIAIKLTTVMMLLVLAITGFAGYSEYKFRQKSDALDADIGTYKRMRWDRPVLRGRAGEGNAAHEALQSLQGVKRLTSDQRDKLATHVYYGAPLTPEQLALVTSHAPLLTKLRGATQLSWSMTELAVDQGDRLAYPPYPLIMDTMLLLLAQASTVSADECLMICADAVRFGQDLVPGATVEASSVAMRIASVAVPVISRCSTGASSDALARAARELNTMATHPPPAGSGIEVLDILARVRLRNLAELNPDDSDDTPLTRLRRRPALLAAFTYFENPTRWRELTATQYPTPLETWLREDEWRSRSELPLISDATTGVDGWLQDDMRGQAIVRALTVGLGTLAARLRQKRIPNTPVGLDEAGLRDPYNGQKLKWRVPQEGNELAVWSVGEDRRDDKGSSEWTAQAPLDVVVHFPLKPILPVVGKAKAQH